MQHLIVNSRRKPFPENKEWSMYHAIFFTFLHWSWQKGWYLGIRAKYDKLFYQSLYSYYFFSFLAGGKFHTHMLMFNTIGYPEDEAASLEQFEYRWTEAPELTLAGFHGDEMVGVGDISWWFVKVLFMI